MKNLLKFLKLYFLPRIKLIAIMLLLILMLNLLVLVNPIIIQKIIDNALIPKNLDSLILLFVLGLLLNIVKIVIDFYHKKTLIIFTNNTFNSLRINFYTHVQKLDLKFFNKTKIGDILNRMGVEIDSLGSLLRDDAIELIVNSLTIVILTIAIFIYDLKLALISLAVVPIYVISVKYFSKKLNKLNEELAEIFSNVSSFVIERLSGIKLIKELVIQNKMIKEHEELTAKRERLIYQGEMTFRINILIPQLATFSGPLLVLLFGAYSIQQGTMSAGQVMGFYYFVYKFYSPINSIINNGLNIQKAKVSMKRIFEYMDLDSNIQENENPLKVEDLQGNISFKDLKFGYEPENEILKGLNFEINAGERVGIVGKSGSGKSTLINLIYRFYDVISGSIEIDNNDIRDYQLAGLRKNIGIVSQEVILLHESIFDNLKIANNNATFEDIIRVCKLVNIHDFIESLPEKYDTIVGENGSKLSGGQKQRISIARVLLKNPKIILFDEATSHLDNSNEKIIQEITTKYFKDKTILVIAHRLTTLTNMDKIFVIDQGQILEEGKHEELLDKKGLYWDLWMRND